MNPSSQVRGVNGPEPRESDKLAPRPVSQLTKNVPETSKEVAIEDTSSEDSQEKPSRSRIWKGKPIRRRRT